MQGKDPLENSPQNKKQEETDLHDHEDPTVVVIDDHESINDNNDQQVDADAETGNVGSNAAAKEESSFSTKTQSKESSETQVHKDLIKIHETSSMKR